MIFKFLGIIMILGLLGIWLYSPKQSSPANTQELTATTQSSRYVTYAKEVFEQAKDKKRVYYFHAPWCPTCRPADAEFQANNQNIPEDVMLFKTDYDSSGDLKKQYAITYQHTFVLVDENGIEVKKWNGGGMAELITNTQ